jgi:hypothetical protein
VDAAGQELGRLDILVNAGSTSWSKVLGENQYE